MSVVGRILYFPDGRIRWISFVCPWIVILGISMPSLCLVFAQATLLAYLVFGIAVLASPLTVIAVIVAAIRRNRLDVHVAIIALVTSATGFGGLWLSSLGYESYVRSHEAACIPVMEAATRFHRDRGNYPDRIQDLVPAYLPDVPAPFQSDTLVYFHSNASPTRVENFSVMFQGMGMQEFIWSSDQGEWHMVD